MAADLLGRWGESIAANYLRKKEYLLLGANYRCRCGEIDLIAKKEDLLVFVEVKLRKNADYGEAREFVNLKKQERIKLTAAMYLSRYELDDLRTRFDVIEIYAPEGTKTKKPEIRHLEDAFR